MGSPPNDSRQVLVWTVFIEWVIAYYEHGWHFSQNYENDDKLDESEAIGWRECPSGPPDDVCPPDPSVN